MQINNLLVYFERSFDELFTLESIIKLTQEACLDREENSIHYNLTPEKQFSLSQERNHYINMLTIALEKVEDIKNYNLLIEKEISYLK